MHKKPLGADHTQDAPPTPTQATKILQLNNPPNIEDIPTLCHKAISSIINKANRKLMNKLRQKEDALYKKSPKRYHASLKTSASLQPRAKDQPNLDTIRDPNPNEVMAQPRAIRDTVQSHYKLEHSRTTPDTLPTPLGKIPPTHVITKHNLRTMPRLNTP